jgi:hypothetical protein
MSARLSAIILSCLTAIELNSVGSLYLPPLCAASLTLRASEHAAALYGGAEIRPVSQSAQMKTDFCFAG